MPNMSGRELVDRALKLRPSLLYVYTSGYTENAIVHHGVLDPDTPFIQKPFAIQELTKTVREVLDAGRTRP